MCQNSHPTPSQHTAHASLKVGNLLSSRLCLKAYLQTHLWFQTCMQGHIPQGVPVGHPTAPGEGTQVWQVVFHGRAGQPSWKTPLVPASSSHGSALGWGITPSAACSGTLTLNYWVVFLALPTDSLQNPLLSWFFSVTKGVPYHRISLMLKERYNTDQESWHSKR